MVYLGTDTYKIYQSSERSSGRSSCSRLPLGSAVTPRPSREQTAAPPVQTAASHRPAELPQLCPLQNHAPTPPAAPSSRLPPGAHRLRGASPGPAALPQYRCPPPGRVWPPRPPPSSPSLLPAPSVPLRAFPLSAVPLRAVPPPNVPELISAPSQPHKTNLLFWGLGFLFPEMCVASPAVCPALAFLMDQNVWAALEIQAEIVKFKQSYGKLHFFP